MTNPRKQLLHTMPANTVVSLVFIITSILLQAALVPLNQWATATNGHDAIFQTYLLSWGSHSLASHPASFYNPPIFHPNTNVAQSTDCLELPSMIMTPLWVFTRNPYLLANCLVVIAHCFALVAAYIVVRKQFSLNRALAVLVACLFAVCSDRLWHSAGHFNLIWSGILPLVWFFSWRVLDRPVRGGDLAITLGLSIYFSVYFFVFSILCVVAAMAVWLASHGRWPSRRQLAMLATAIVGAVIIALPKIAIYAWAAHGIESLRNTLGEAALYSADWRGYLLPTQPESGLVRVTGWGTRLGQFGENGQFIGYFFSAILLCEMIRLIRQFAARKPTMSDKISLASLGLGILLVLCSFGPEFTIIGISPYRILYYTFLQFTGFFRVPARLAFVSQWLLVIPAAIFFASIRLNTNKWASIACTAIALPWIMFEHLPLEHPSLVQKSNIELLAAMDKIDPAHAEAYIDIRPDLTLELPLANIPNWRPTVNGWTGAALDPSFDVRARSFINDFPSTPTIGWLAAHNVPWVITHDPGHRQALSDEQFQLIASSEDAQLFRIADIASAKKYWLEYQSSRQQELQTLRDQTPEIIRWPDSSLVRIVPENATAFDPAKDQATLTKIARLPPTAMASYLRFSPTYWFCVQPAMPFPPGIYDRVTIEYQLSGPDTKHRANIFWGTNPTLTETRRVKADLDHVENGITHWQAEFELSNNSNWIYDPTANWLLIEFDRFKGESPKSIRITGLKLTRKDSE